MSVAYFDTSALVKLVVRETETAALLRWIRQPDAPQTMTTSMLVRVELVRAARRHSSAAAEKAGLVLDGLDQVAMTPDILTEAGALSPATLRTLDAIHLATAHRVGSSLAAFVAYDRRLLEAAASAGLPVVDPQ